MYEVGSTVTLSYSLVSSDGAAVAAASAAVTITLPDGSTAAGTPTAGGTGEYSYSYTPGQAGRHTVRWEFTDPTVVETDVFNVAAGSSALIGMAEAREALGMDRTDRSKDSRLRPLLEALTPVVEGYVGAVLRRTVVETRDGGRPAVLLTQGPVLSVTTVTECGTTVDAAGYQEAAGVLTRLAGGQPYCWLPGVGNVEVSYVVGRATVTPNLQQCVAELVAVNGRRILGGNHSAYDQDQPEGGEWRLGFWVPRSVIALLEAEPQPAGIA